jgi:two-component system NarL family sensor kinase
MELRYKIVLLAVAPLVLGAVLVVFVVEREGKALADRQVAEARQILLAARQEELRHLVAVAKTAIDHLEGAERDDEVIRKQVLALLRGMGYGQDGYFWVTDTHARGVMHPRLPELEGQDISRQIDVAGRPLVPQFIAKARAGGGFVQYPWPRSTRQGRMSQKLGYAVLLPRWDWVIGTGVYLDDVEAITRQIRDSSSDAVGHTMLFILVAAVLATLAVAAAGLVLNMSQRRLADSKLRELTRQVLIAQNEERARVSRELHDGVVHDLGAVRFDLEATLHELRARAPDEKLAEALERVRAELTRCVEEIRRISTDLRPPMQGDGLEAALEQIRTEVSRRTGLSITLEQPPTWRPMSNKIATALFRVAQEALRNVERHARATGVAIRLAACARGGSPGISLTVSDNGRGFDVTDVEGQRSDGIGLSSMRERIEALGGQFAIRSGPKGTVIEAILPDGALEEDDHDSNDDQA